MIPLKHKIFAIFAHRQNRLFAIALLIFDCFGTRHVTFLSLIFNIYIMLLHDMQVKKYIIFYTSPANLGSQSASASVA